MTWVPGVPRPRALVRGRGEFRVRVLGLTVLPCASAGLCQKPSEDSNRLSPGGLVSPRLYIQSGALQDIAFHLPAGRRCARAHLRRDEHRARGVGLANLVFEPPTSRRLSDPDRLLPSFSRLPSRSPDLDSSSSSR